MTEIATALGIDELIEFLAWCVAPFISTSLLKFALGLTICVQAGRFLGSIGRLIEAVGGPAKSCLAPIWQVAAMALLTTNLHLKIILAA